MRIAVVGSGNIGGTLGSLWARAGHSVYFTSRHPENLESLVKELGPSARAVELRRAVTECEVVLLATPLKALPETIAPLSYRLSGKFVIDAMNPFPDRDGAIAEEALAKRAAVLLTAERLPEARITRAFSNIYFKVLQSEAHRDGPRLAVPYATNDPDAVPVVEHLIRDAGFEAYGIGMLKESKPLDPDGKLFKTSYSVKELEGALQEE
jgi:8-hydroxy-5-deazaflavin:NADPH oxidoreductase